MVPIWLLSIRKVKETVPREKLPLLGIAAAFSFLAMMFNIPLPGGTTGHAVGGTLIAILFGPYAACLAVSVALLIQALFFGDGGILAPVPTPGNMAARPALYRIFHLSRPEKSHPVRNDSRRYRRLYPHQRRGLLCGCGIRHPAPALYGREPARPCTAPIRYGFPFQP